MHTDFHILYSYILYIYLEFREFGQLDESTAEPEEHFEGTALVPLTNNNTKHQLQLAVKKTFHMTTSPIKDL